MHEAAEDSAAVSRHGAAVALAAVVVHAEEDSPEEVPQHGQAVAEEDADDTHSEQHEWGGPGLRPCP